MSNLFNVTCAQGDNVLVPAKPDFKNHIRQLNVQNQGTGAITFTVKYGTVIEQGPITLAENQIYTFELQSTESEHYFSAGINQDIILNVTESSPTVQAWGWSETY